MSVLIKGIELPEKVQVFELHSDGKVFTRKGYLVGEAVELPDHHGRLVDADALGKAVAGMVPYAIDDASSSAYTDGIGAAYYLIGDAPTIVESESES